VRVLGVFVSVPTLALLLACGSSGREQDGEPRDADAHIEGFCGKAAPLCEVDRCQNGECAFVEIARFPGPVFEAGYDATHVYAIGAQRTTVYRVPKCGGTPEVVLRTAGSIGTMTVGTDALYWITNTSPLSRLYRSPKDGIGATTEIVFDATPDGTAIAVVADAAGAYSVRTSSPGILQLDAGMERVVQDAPVDRSSVLANREHIFLHSWELGTRRVSKLYGTVETVLDPLLPPLAVDDHALYYTDSQTNPAARALYRWPHGATPTLLYQSNLLYRLVADDRCAYLILNATPVPTNTTSRLRLDGNGETPIWSGEQHLVVADEDTLYVVAASGSIYRRPK
jgi:hypothetical protein